MNVKEVTLWTALITPLNPSNQIDYPNLKELLLLQKKANNGVVLLGSTGEGTNLPHQIKKEIIQFVDGLHLEIPLMVGIGGSNIEEQLEWVDFLESFQSINCYLVVTPIYAKPGKKGQYYWFKKILDQSTRPCMLYNIPGRAGIKLNLEAAIQLADHPNFYSIKEASGDLSDFKNFKQNLYHIKIYSGDDGLFYDHARLGAYGLVSVASNVWPRETHQYVTDCLNNTLEDKLLWSESCNSLFLASNPVPVKRLMYAKKMISSPYLYPPLHFEDLEKLEPILASDKKITNWLKSNQKE